MLEPWLAGSLWCSWSELQRICGSFSQQWSEATEGGFGLRGETFRLLVLGCKLGLDHPNWGTWARESDVARPKIPVDPRNITEEASHHSSVFSVSLTLLLRSPETLLVGTEYACMGEQNWKPDLVDSQAKSLKILVQLRTELLICGTFLSLS